MTAIHPHYFRVMLEGGDGQRFAIYVDAWCRSYSVEQDRYTLRYKKTEFTNIAEPVYHFTLSFAERDIAALFKLSWAGPPLESHSVMNPGP